MPVKSFGFRRGPSTAIGRRSPPPITARPVIWGSLSPASMRVRNVAIQYGLLKRIAVDQERSGESVKARYVEFGESPGPNPAQVEVPGGDGSD